MATEPDVVRNVGGTTIVHIGKPTLNLRTGKSTVAYGYVEVIPAPTTGPLVPWSRPRSTPRGQRSRRASTGRRTQNRGSPERSTDGGDADGGDADQHREADLTATLALLDCLCTGALERDDMQTAIDAAAAGWAESFAAAWMRLDPDLLCPRCSSPWTVHRSGQRFCVVCYRNTLAALERRSK